MNHLLPKRHPVLEEMEALAARNRIPIVGPAVGRLLYQLGKFAGAKRIFEMGSAIGYSTIWWAQSLQPGGKVFYSDGSAENAKKADDFITRAGVRDRTELLVGNSLDLIDTVEGEFDVIFNDVDKHYYADVYRKVADRVRIGGVLVADNVLWSGRVADLSLNDPNTEAIRSFNQMLFADKRYYSTIMPLRDGVAIGIRTE